MEVEPRYAVGDFLEVTETLGDVGLLEDDSLLLLAFFNGELLSTFSSVFCEEDVRSRAKICLGDSISEFL